MNRLVIEEKARRYTVVPLAKALSRIGCTPTQMTLLGLILAAAAGYLISEGMLFYAGVAFLIGGVLDSVDGTMARMTKSASAAGALLDSVADRIGEAIVLIGLLLFYLNQSPPDSTGAILVCVVLVSSGLVSYIRARADGLGIICRIGIMTRPERVIGLGVGLVVGQPTVALLVVLVFSTITVGQRFTYVWRASKRS